MGKVPPLIQRRGNLDFGLLWSAAFLQVLASGIARQGLIVPASETMEGGPSSNRPDAAVCQPTIIESNTGFRFAPKGFRGQRATGKRR